MKRKFYILIFILLLFADKAEAQCLISLSSGTGTDNQTVCINSPITNITYNTVGATDAAVTGLPAGVSGSWAADVVTINGTPTESGTFNYTVTLTGTGCGGILTTGSIKVTALPVATFSYTGTPYCSNETNPSPSFSGGGVAGTFSSTTGLVFVNTSTGQVDLAASTAGTYTVTNTIAAAGGCAIVTATAQITITDLPVATFSYTGTPYCSNGTNPSPAFSGGGVAGTFSSTTGLVFVSTSTGQVNLAASTAGTYTVTNTIAAAGGCAIVTATAQIIITDLPVATFSYTSTPYCSNGTNPSPTFSGGGEAGIFSSTTGLVFVSTSTGQVNLDVSTPGTYTVTNTIAAAGGCAIVKATAQITITDLPVATFSYTGTPYCSNGTNPSPTFSGGGKAGAFSSTTGLVFVNNSTGQVNLAASNAGTYTITNTIAAAGGCGVVTATAQITITDLPVATFSYTSTPYCSNGTNPSPTFSGGGVAGIFSSTTGLVFVSTSTGQVNLAASTPGTYTVTNTIAAAGGCAIVTATAQITITALPVATFSYTSTPYCSNGTNPSPTFSGGGVAGAFSSTTGLVFISTSTGQVNLAASTAGTYTVTNTIAAAGGCGIVTASGPITITSVNTVSLTSAVGTNAQALCINTAITNITYSTTGATGASFSGLPTGVTGAWASNAVIISGTPTVSGTFSYTVTLTGGCGAVTATGTITVNPLPVPTLTSSDADHVICQGTSVIFTAGGGTTYTFRVGGVAVQSGTLATYTTSSLINGQTVDVIVTNANGCSATSSGMQFLVNAPPFIFIYTSPACSADLTTYSLAVVVSTGTVTSTSGVATNSGSNIWTITGILAGVNVTVTVTDPGGCVNTLAVTAPNCACPVISAPVSGGDKSYCASGTIPTISATVSTGETVDWYSASSDGTLLKSGSLSYTPTAAGTYYAQARNTNTNCVSSTRTAITVTMNTLPIPSLVSSDADNIFCAGTSVIFTAGGGTSYNFRVGGTSVQSGTSTTYTTSSLTNGQIVDVIVTNTNGCTATSSGITNTVNSLPTPTLTSSDADNTFCAGTSVTFTAGGGASYNFRIDGTSVQNATLTTYTTSSLTNGQVVSVIVTNSNGCAATSTGITNTVKAIPTPTLTSSDADNVFCAGTNVIFTAGGGTNYNFRVGGTSVQNSASTTYTTSSLTNGQVVDVIVTNSVGCSVTSTGITNTIIPQPNANAGTGGNACDLNFKFSGVASVGIGTWTKTSGPGTVTFSPNANTANATVTVSDYGSYTFTWTEVNGVCSSSSVISVNFYLQPVAGTGTGGNNCGLEMYLNGTLNIGEGTWSKVSGPGNVTFSPDEKTANASVTVSVFGTYVFKWSVINATCANSTTMTVNFIEQPPANAGTGGSECDLDFVFSAESTTGTGTWQKIDGPGNVIFTPDNHQPNAKVTVDQYGTYDFEWTVVNSACTSSDKVQVIFREMPLINAGRDTVICKGGSVKLNALGTGSFAWSPTEFVSDSTIMDPVVNPVTTTSFKVTLTDQSGCKNSDDVIVEVREKPIAYAGNNQVLDYLFGTTMDAELNQTYETGVWSVISGTGEFLDKRNPSTTVKKLSLGVNKFLWTVTNGYCTASYDTVTVVVKDIVIPTLITPNMDGRNDYFVLKGLTTLGKTELIIFNRKGAEVYKNLNYNNSWNGVDYNGSPLPDDTYFYVLKSENGISKSGFVVIRHKE